MLSFMKEDGNQNIVPESSKVVETLKDVDDQEEIRTEDYLVPSAFQKKVKYSTLILGIVFVIGVLSLFMMIKKSTPAQAKAGLSDQELKIESAIAKLTGSKTQMNGKMNDIVNMIASLSDVKQVKVGELKKNPFSKRNSFKSSVSKPGFISNLISKKNGSKGLKLWSIMESDHEKSCMINGEILKENDTFESYTVKKIGNGFVDMVSDKTSLTLRIAQ